MNTQKQPNHGDSNNFQLQADPRGPGVSSEHTHWGHASGGRARWNHCGNRNLSGRLVDHYGARHPLVAPTKWWVLGPSSHIPKNPKIMRLLAISSPIFEVLGGSRYIGIWWSLSIVAIVTTIIIHITIITVWCLSVSVSNIDRPVIIIGRLIDQ